MPTVRATETVQCPLSRAFRPEWVLLRLMSFLSIDADVTFGAGITGLTATAPQFAGIVTVWLGKTAREGGSGMTLMGHAEEQCRHVTWGASERSRDQRRR